MTTKQRNVLDWYWQKLYDTVREYQRGVTAGELAKEMGVSRSTAQKYLSELITNKAATAEKFKHWNKQTGKRYSPIGDSQS